MKSLLLYLSFLLIPVVAWPQIDGWIFFDEKPGAVLSDDYFEAFALEHKQKLDIPVGSFTDLPVSAQYLSQVSIAVDSVYGVSRWLNAAAVSATPSQWAMLADWPFVIRIVRYKQSGASLTQVDEEWPTLRAMDSVLLEYQTRRLGRAAWQHAGITGMGVRVGIADGGFPGVDTHPAFAHLRAQNRIIATYDFLRQDTFVYAHHRHGTAVLSCIAGRYEDSMLIGLAPDVSVVLARTERGLTESIKEELAWINAIEWMDRFGVSIVNSSLGYTDIRYFEEDMDGRTSPIVLAANEAVKKGILIVSAAGNEGDIRWGTVGTPADGDSVLSVGATDPFTDYATGFSSHGPTADGRLKPNVAAPGIVLAATPNNFGQTGGTSFSSPLVAGFAACLLQLNPNLDPVALLHAIEQAGHLYPYYDYHHGYGVPQAEKILGLTVVDSQSFTIKPSGDYINIVIHSDYIPARDEDDKMLSAPRNIYYHIATPNGRIRKYSVVAAEEKEAYFIGKEDLRAREVLRVHFEGLTKTYKKP